MSRLLFVLLLGSPAATPEGCDFFCHLGQANKASLVMLVEEGLVPAALAPISPSRSTG